MLCFVRGGAGHELYYRKEDIMDKSIENMAIKLFYAILNYFLRKYDFGTHDKTVEFLMKKK